MKFAIFDWAGNRLFPTETWESFEAAWSTIYLRFDNEEDYQELYVEEAAS